MLKSKFRFWLYLLITTSAVFITQQASADSEVPMSTYNRTAVELDEEDLKFYYEKTLINIPKENKRTVMRLKGARWEADATDGQGRVLSRNAFVWKGGSAMFDKSGNMSDLSLNKAGRTIKGVSIGSPISAIKRLYPQNYSTTPDKFGDIYFFEFNAYGKARRLMFVTNSSTGKVTSIILRNQ